MQLKYITSCHYYSMGKQTKANSQERYLETLENVLLERIPEDLNVKLESIELLKNLKTQITLQGKKMDDLTFTSNILKEITGESIRFDKLSNGMIIRGSINDLGKVGFGLFIDAGIEEPSKQALLPLHALRNQLVKNEKIPLNEICDKYGFMNNLQLNFEIVDINNCVPENPKIEVKIAQNSIEQIKNWVFQGLDIVFAVGASRQFIKRAVAKKGHSLDIIEIQRLGIFESALICKQGTRASGIISHIGSDLPECIFSSLLTKQIRNFWR